MIVDVLMGDPIDRKEWRETEGIRRRVYNCPYYDDTLKECIVAHYADPTCTWSVWYTIEKEYLTTNANMLY